MAVFRNFDESPIIWDGETNLSEWAKEYSLPRVLGNHESHFDLLFDSERPSLVLFTEAKVSENEGYLKNFHTVAQKMHKENVKFFHAAHHKGISHRLFEMVGIHKGQLPALFLISDKGDGKMGFNKFLWK